MRIDDDRWKAAADELASRAAGGTHNVLRGSQRIAHGWLSEGEIPSFGQHHDRSPANWLGLALFKKAMEGGPPVISCGCEGNLTVEAKALLKALPEALSVRVVAISEGGNGNGSFIFSSETAMIALDVMEAGKAAMVRIVTTDKELAVKANQLFDRAVVPDNPESGLVFTLAQGMGGYNIRRLGSAGTVLERGNYNPAVLADYDHVVSDLASESPCGRLTILSGAPGTGKTYLVRSLLSAVKKAAFVVVPTHLVQELGSPEILPALTQAKSEFSGPIVLILEDADKVLVNRNQGDMSGISAMLNLGDGILGAVLDIRILATTNAEKLEMDPATRRPGRLCRYIQVDNLAPVTARNVYKRLTGSPASFTEPMSLAEVYQSARQAGWVAPPIANRRPQLVPHLL